MSFKKVMSPSKDTHCFELALWDQPTILVIEAARKYKVKSGRATSPECLDLINKDLLIRESLWDLMKFCRDFFRCSSEGGGGIVELFEKHKAISAGYPSSLY